jgi:hypothetical protein
VNVALRIASSALFLAGCLLVTSCGTPTPSSPTTDAPGGFPTPKTGAASSQVFEEFNCASLEDVSVRFSDPGFAEANRVGLFVKYEGAPPGEKLLRVWWDHDADATRYQDIRLGEGEPRRDDSSRFDIETVVEHVYAPVTAPVTLLVRTELILVGKTGNCARNRTVTLEPEPPPAPPEEESSPEPPAGPGTCGERYCDLGNGTVRDNFTGLVWLRNPRCLPVRRWQGALNLTAALGDGQCGLTDGTSPGDWRLPTQMELETLLDLRFANPSLSNAQGDSQWAQGDAFVGVENRFYWSSDRVDECVGAFPGAVAVHLGNGEARCRLIIIFFTRFWPVRATP